MITTTSWSIIRPSFDHNQLSSFFLSSFELLQFKVVKIYFWTPHILFVLMTRTNKSGWNFILTLEHVTARSFSQPPKPKINVQFFVNLYFTFMKHSLNLPQLKQFLSEFFPSCWVKVFYRECLFFSVYYFWRQIQKKMPKSWK